MKEKLSKEENSTRRKKVALFHPWIKSRGGAEKCVLEILKSKNFDVDVYTWVYDKEKTFDEFQKYDVKLVGSKFAKKISRTYLLRGLFFINSLLSKIPLENYDLFLVSTSGVGEFILFRNYKPKKTFAYVYTPLRAATKEIVDWDLKNRHKNFFKKIIYLSMVHFYRFLEKISWKKIDFPIFISELSLERAEQRNLAKDKEKKIIYPPIEIEKFKKLKSNNGDYFLYVSRINQPKRQDVLIKAWKEFIKNYPNEKLIIAGSSENKNFLDEIKKLAEDSENIFIKTDLNQKELLELYSNSKAVIFVPFLEDFGIVPFEAMALGKPLIAVEKGGYSKLIEKFNYYRIKELYSEEKMIEEINRVLEEFMESEKKVKKIQSIGNNTQNFIKKIEEALLQ